jgi:nucleotide-binding universal stress UspA family protein
MKTIFVLIHDDAGQDARLEAALDVVRAQQGHLTCLDITQLPVMVGDIYGIVGQDRLMEAERAVEAENRARIEARLIREGVSWDWVDAVGDMGPTINAFTDLADLIILNRRLDASPGPDMLAIAGAVVLGSHKPVLAVPEASRGIDVSGHALIAWDGSPQAANAVRQALPMLRLAGGVGLVAIDDKPGAVTAEDAALYLSRHGIEARIEMLAGGGMPVHELLIERCRAHRSALLVMGGYGHSRIAEALFGGVTKAMLSSAPVPLLIAH